MKKKPSVRSKLTALRASNAELLLALNTLIDVTDPENIRDNFRLQIVRLMSGMVAFRADEAAKRTRSRS